MIEINGDVTMEKKTKQPTGCENRASQQIDQGLLIFVITTSISEDQQHRDLK